MSIGLIGTDWRSNAFIFRTIKLAFGQVLDEFEPTGEIKPPAKQEPADIVVPRPFFMPGAGFFWDAGTTPEQLAPFVCAAILTSLKTASKKPVEDAVWGRVERSSAQEQFEYDMSNANRDLMKGTRP